MYEIKANITGNVQMVMFRDYVKRSAIKFDLSGTVKNLGDGSVEVIAQGNKDDLKKLVKLLHKGPMLASVIRVHVEWRKPVEDFDSFIIVY